MIFYFSGISFIWVNGKFKQTVIILNPIESSCSDFDVPLKRYLNFEHKNLPNPNKYSNVENSLV